MLFAIKYNIFYDRFILYNLNQKNLEVMPLCFYWISFFL